MNASETLLREILREVKKQNVLLEKIDRKLSRDDDISPDEMERRESFRKDIDMLRETIRETIRAHKKEEDGETIPSNASGP